MLAYKEVVHAPIIEYGYIIVNTIIMLFLMDDRVEESQER